MQQSALEQKISALIEPSLEGMGYEIVRVMMQEGSRRKTLQIMLDRADGEPISVDDCEKASRQISALMDVEDPVDGEYNLEVSSPGLDRPLTRERDFERFAGYEVKISLVVPMEGRKRFTGLLQGLEDGNAILYMTDTQEDILLPLENIAAAKLVITDDMFATNAPKSEKNKKH